MGYALVGLAIERVTQERLADLMRAQILDPLGLDSVAWTPEEHASAPRARGYWYPRDPGQPRPVPALPSVSSFAGAGGALHGDALSLARLGHELFTGGLLDDSQLREMSHFRPAAGRVYAGAEYGLGLVRVSIDDIEVWGHSGDGFGFHSELWYVPSERLTLATLWNDDALEDPQIPQSLLRIALPAS